MRTVLIFLLLLPAWLPAQGPARPNIVWLVAEDLSPLLAPFGDSTVRTPNIERLAAEGIRFTNVYSTSGVCAPSRATLATGMYHNSIGAHNMRTLNSDSYLVPLGLISYEAVPPPAVRMMSEVLRRYGYYCINNAKTDYQFVHPLTAWDESSPYAHWRKRAPGQPFFSIFNFDVTHESQVFEPHRRIIMRYDGDFPGDPVTSPAPAWGDMMDSSEWNLYVPEDLPVPVPPYLPDTEPVRRDVRRVYSNVVELDRQLGVILRQLEADGLLDSTIIVFYADHGGPLPRQKRLLYDSGLRVPMIIRFPDRWRAGQIDSQLVSFVDFAPTTFSLAGIEPPGWLQGQAFLGPYRAARPRTYIHAAADRFDERADRIRAVRDGRFKYLRNFHPDRPYYLPLSYREQMVSMQELLRLRDAGRLDEIQMQWFRSTKPPEELFDTWSDPHELNNLAGDPRYADKLHELRAECDRWMTAVDDKGAIPEAELLERFWPRRVQPVTSPPRVEVVEDRLIMSCPAPGASIGYRPAGAGPATPWQVFTAPVSLSDLPAEGLEIRADRIGYAPSKAVVWGEKD